MVKHSDALSRTFGALADPIRRDVLERLAAGAASVSQLAEPHGLTLAGMLKHLRILEDAGLLRSAKDGRVRRCGLTPKPMRRAASYLDRYRRLWEGRFDALEQLLAQGEEEKS